MKGVGVEFSAPIVKIEFTGVIKYNIYVRYSWRCICTVINRHTYTNLKSKETFKNDLLWKIIKAIRR